jgi:hypothetical protein
MLKTGIKGYVTKNQNQSNLKKNKNKIKIETKTAPVIKNSKLKMGSHI